MALNIPDIPFLNFFKKNNSQTAKSDLLVGIYIDQLTINITLVQGSNLNDFNIKAYKTIEANNTEQKITAIKNFVSEYKIKNIPCCIVLTEKEYSLHLIESPKVPANELKSAIQWTISDIIDTSIESLNIESFELPSSRSIDNVKMAYAITSLKTLTEKLEKIIVPSELILKYIDIQELAIKNLLRLNKTSHHSYLSIIFSEDNCNIFIAKKNNILLTRKIKFNEKDLLNPTEEILDNLALELQRTLDSYYSTFSHSAINNIILLPSSYDFITIKTMLEQRMSLNIHLLDLAKYLDINNTSINNPLLFSIAAAMYNLDYDSSESMEEDNAKN